MNLQGRVRIGHKAPDFHCDAVTKGVIEDVTLNTYIDPTAAIPTCLILFFISMAFSFVCPIEFLACQNCLEGFKDQNCDILVRDYGMLLEEEGISLRGMFILDGEGVVQQVTLNNLTVGRSVLETLRLEAFQAVAKHRVLCPHRLVTLTESYDDRLANLQKEFGDAVVVTDLDAKHKHEDQNRKEISRQNSSQTNGNSSESSASGVTGSESAGTRALSQSQPDSGGHQSPYRALPSPPPPPNQISPRTLPPPPPPPPPKRKRNADANTRRSPVSLPRTSLATATAKSNLSAHSTSAPAPLPPQAQAPYSPNLSNNLSPTISLQQSLPNNTGHYSVPLTHALPKHKTYASRRGSHIVLKFADPTFSPQASPNGIPLPTPLSAYQTLSSSLPPSHPHHRHSHSYSHSSPEASITSMLSPALSRQSRHLPTTPSGGGGGGGTGSGSIGGGQTRLQVTFEAIKKIGC
ncbi:thioredoxin-like protein [Lentithecium fluviatile CBS 122367]|uniref:Thioredoxin-like protein n=1 Tax=Lentithecium fluviatile CBS 122367 TaxID=1168545 RepID=A0A6G1J7D5_9PLEO|nr:thioredoxin-like protein [Lentithecium fluviatile CBS 122367]